VSQRAGRVCVRSRSPPHSQSAAGANTFQALGQAVALTEVKAKAHGTWQPVLSSLSFPGWNSALNRSCTLLGTMPSRPSQLMSPKRLCVLPEPACHMCCQVSRRLQVCCACAPKAAHAPVCPYAMTDALMPSRRSCTTPCIAAAYASSCVASSPSTCSRCTTSDR